MVTRNGVFYDLTKSHYKCVINNLTFVFSSYLHLKKFKKKLEEHRKTVNNSLTNRFNIDVDVSLLADVVLYKKIETRGFLIVSQEGRELCQKDITCVGLTVTEKNYNEQ